MANTHANTDHHQDNIRRWDQQGFRENVTSLVLIRFLVFNLQLSVTGGSSQRDNEMLTKFSRANNECLSY